MRNKRITGSGLLLLGFFGAAALSALGSSAPTAPTPPTSAEEQEGKQTIMSTNVGDQDSKKDSQEPGSVIDTTRPAGAEGATNRNPTENESGQAQQLQTQAPSQSALKLPPEQQMSLAPHAIMVHTELLSAKQELNGIRTQLHSLPPGTAPDREAIQHLAIYTKDVNTDLRNVATHQAELKGATKAIPQMASADVFTRMDSSVSTVLASNDTWQAKAKNGAYWKDPSKVTADIDRLTRQIDAALDENQAFSAGQLDVAFVG